MSKNVDVSDWRDVTSVKIDNLAAGGEGVGRLDDGRAVFVRGGCPGDVLAVEIVEDHERFARARIVAIEEPSAERVAPPCPYFGECGGCDWQHVAYPTQLAAKRQIVVDALRRIGHFENAEELVAETVPSPRQYGYRNKIELAAFHDSGRLELGYHAPGSSTIIPIDRCLLLPKKFEKAPRSLKGALRFVEGSDDLGLQRVALRVGTNTSDVEVALWTAPGSFPRRPAATTLGQALPTTSIVRVLVKGPPKERRVSGVEVFSGKGFWREKLLGREIAVSAPTFLQVNTKIAEALIQRVLGALQPDGTDRVLDLYSGAGTFTLPLAEVAGEVVAVEAASTAVRDLRRNLERHQLYADVVGGDATRELLTLGRVDLALVDPPRSGLRPEAEAALAKTGARTIAYVSCDPATLARDARQLVALGYRVSSATPLDMFPQTCHVETLVTLHLKDM